jgi:Zn-finger nucleic acid-binding protein
MNCPSCKQELKKISTGGLTVFVCQGGCAGLWFGRYELLKLNAQNQGNGERLLYVPQAEGVRFFRDVEAICPQCKTSLLLRHFFSREQNVEVCQCPKCGGFWIDAGELASIVKPRLETEGKQKQAVDAYFNTIFDERILKMNLANEDIFGSAKSIVKIFLFLCPEQFQPLKTSLLKEYFSGL